MAGVVLEISVKVMPKFVLWFWRFSWVMFGLSFFTSKSGLSIFSGLLILTSLYFINWKAFFKQRWLALFAASVPLGMFLNLFSLGGWESSVRFLASNPWPLMAIPGFCLIKQKEELNFLLWPLSFSLIAALIKSLHIFNNDYGFIFSTKTRVQSYFDIGRWGQFIASAGVVLAGLSYSKVFKKNIVSNFLRILFIFSTLFLIVSNTRGPWLGFFIGIVVLAILVRKHLIAISVTMAVAILIVMSSSGISNRVKSIFAVGQDRAGKITSVDASNAGRLHMWKVSIDHVADNIFFGAGFKNLESSLRPFLNKQTEYYLNEYVTAEFSYNDAHSSYLQSLVEMGIFFFAYYWAIILGFFIYAVKKSFVHKNIFFPIVVAGILANLIIYIFYSSYASYEGVIIVSLFFLEAWCSENIAEVTRVSTV